MKIYCLSTRQKLEKDWEFQNCDVLRSAGVAKRPLEYSEGQSWKIPNVRGVLVGKSSESDSKESLVSKSDDSRALSEPHEDNLCVQLKEASPWYGLQNWQTEQQDLQPSSGAFTFFFYWRGKEEGLRDPLFSTQPSPLQFVSVWGKFSMTWSMINWTPPLQCTVLGAFDARLCRIWKMQVTRKEQLLKENGSRDFHAEAKLSWMTNNCVIR